MTFAKINGSVIIDITDVELNGGSVFGGDNSVSIVTFSGQVNICEIVFVIDTTLHLPVNVLSSACFHCGDKYFNLIFNNK